MKLKLPVLILMLTGIAACAGDPPYVDRPYEINRDSPDFPVGPPVVDGSSVTVCYAKSETTADEIRALAEQECAKGGLQAAFIRQSLATCPMMTPVAAYFKCTAAVGGNRVLSPNTVPAPVIAAPSFAAPKPAGAGRPLGSIGAADVSTTAKSQPFPTYLFNSPQPAR